MSCYPYDQIKPNPCIWGLVPWTMCSCTMGLWALVPLNLVANNLSALGFEASSLSSYLSPCCILAYPKLRKTLPLLYPTPPHSNEPLYCRIPHSTQTFNPSPPLRTMFGSALITSSFDMKVANSQKYKYNVIWRHISRDPKYYPHWSI